LYEEAVNPESAKDFVRYPGFRQYQRRRQIDSASQRLSDNLFFPRGL